MSNVSLDETPQYLPYLKPKLITLENDLRSSDAVILKSLLAETLSSKYGIKDYLVKENLDDTVNATTIT